MIDNQNYRALSQSGMLIYNQIKSWIKPHQFLLLKAGDRTYPLLERVNFLVRFHTSLDEFFMSRTLDFKHEYEKDGSIHPHNKALTLVLEQLYNQLIPLLEKQDEIWNDSIFPELLANGITIHHVDSLDLQQQRRLREYFIKDVFPLLTPLAFDKTHPFPYISNLSLNLAVVLKETEYSQSLFVRIKIPEDQFPRFIHVPDLEQTMSRPQYDLIYLEDLISANLDLLFPGMQIISSSPFRVTRDGYSQPLNLDKDRDTPEDNENQDETRHNTTVRIEVSDRMEKPICGMICNHLFQFSKIFYRTKAPIGMADMKYLYTLDRPDLKYRHHSEIAQ